MIACFGNFILERIKDNSFEWFCEDIFSNIFGTATDRDRRELAIASTSESPCTKFCKKWYIIYCAMKSAFGALLNKHMIL